MFVLRVLLVLLAAVLVSACTQPGSSSQAGRQADEGPAYDEPDRAPASTRTVIAFLGDSLTAGLGLLSTQAYPSLIGDMFLAEGYHEVEILNGGVSGDTTAGATRRVEQLLSPDVRILVVALGGNDALRGLTVAQTRENLELIVEQAFELARQCRLDHSVRSEIHAPRVGMALVERHRPEIAALRLSRVFSKNVSVRSGFRPDRRRVAAPGSPQVAPAGPAREERRFS